MKLFCKYLNEYKIEENGCLHIIASVEELYVEDNLLHEDNWIQLDRGNVVAINGLDGYAVPKIKDRFQYARPDQPTKSML